LQDCRACRKIFLRILETAHARQHRIASRRKTRFQTHTGLQEQGTDQESRSISALVSRIDPAACQVLGARSEGAGLARAVEEGCRMEAAVREMVRGRETEHFGKLPGPPSQRVAPEQGGNNLGRRTGRQAHAHLSTVASRSLPLRKCVETE